MGKNLELSQYKIDQNSFKFVNSDKRISDTQLKTKPVSFSKDAFRRFCKNKSSIVGAIVLGILILMAIFVPIISQSNVVDVSDVEDFLEPKLFAAGTGFWDGTKKYATKYNSDGTVNSGVLYDFSTESPSGFYAPAVSELVVDAEPTYINTATAAGRFGYFVFENNNEQQINATLNTYASFAVSADGQYKLSFSLLDKEAFEDSKLGEYCVYLLDGADKIVLKDWSKEYGEHTIDLSAILTEKGVSNLDDARLYFELKPQVGFKTYILIKNCLLSCADEEANAALASLNITDATKTSLLGIENQVVPVGYWSCTGRKGVYKSEVHYCNFVYDTYEKAYGVREVVYSASEMKAFKDKGLCDFDDYDIVGTYRVLSEDFFITEVFAPEYNPFTGKLKSVSTRIPNYYKLGYTKMPKFILGTDVNGRDLFTLMFTGLRTSLVLGVCTAAFCFLFGLIWGSISGYFGGVIDLVMERFCDILGGVPWIVVMTLAILHFGNNFLTFFMALCLTGWMGTAARTRTQFYRFKGGEYVLAARTLGSSDLRLIFRHILPNSLGTIVTSSVLMITSTIYSESTLAYLNLGLQGVQSFGVLLANNQRQISSHAYLVVFPAIIMALLMISFNLFGNGLRDALNPQLRGAED